jgi:hypothetical protein
MLQGQQEGMVDERRRSESLVRLGGNATRGTTR